MFYVRTNDSQNNSPITKGVGTVEEDGGLEIVERKMNFFLNFSFFLLEYL